MPRGHNDAESGAPAEINENDENEDDEGEEEEERIADEDEDVEDEEDSEEVEIGDDDNDNNDSNDYYDQQEPPSSRTRLNNDDSDTAAPASRAKRRTPRRVPSVYDAVARRVLPQGLVDSNTVVNPSTWRDRLGGSRIPLTPGEALFRAPGAPQRYHEDDVYASHRHLATADEAQATLAHLDRVGGLDADEREALKQRIKVGTLPDSDLLEAVHGFASRYYGAIGTDRDWRSMDETALLGIAILLEETAKAFVQDGADLAFVERKMDATVQRPKLKPKPKATADVVAKAPVVEESRPDSRSEAGEATSKKRKTLAEDWGDDW